MGGGGGGSTWLAESGSMSSLQIKSMLTSLKNASERSSLWERGEEGKKRGGGGGEEGCEKSKQAKQQC